MAIYVVTFTEFNNGECCHSIQPSLFSKRDYAEDFLAKIFRHKIGDFKKSYLEQKCPEYTDEKGDFVDINGLDYNSLESIMFSIYKGEDIPYLYEWNIMVQYIDVDKRE
jgi:hypothetical protein